MQREEGYGGTLIGLSAIYHALGRNADSDAALRSGEREAATQAPYFIALMHAFRGEGDAALRWLDRAYLQKDYQVQYIKGEWFLRSLQNDPRYKAFLRRMNLPEG